MTPLGIGARARIPDALRAQKAADHGALGAGAAPPGSACGCAASALGGAGALGAAASGVLLHNHPSGDPTPSREDIRLTRQLVECARLLDLRVHDHVVVGHGRYVSLAERGII